MPGMREYIKDSWALLPEKKRERIQGIFDNPSPGPWAPAANNNPFSIQNELATHTDAGDGSNDSDDSWGPVLDFNEGADPAEQSTNYKPINPNIDTTPVIEPVVKTAQAAGSAVVHTLNDVKNLAQFTAWVTKNPVMAIGGAVGIFAFVKYGIPAIFGEHKREPRGAQPVFMSPPPMQYIAPRVQTSYVPQPVMISGLFSRKPRSMVYVPGPVINLQPSSRRTEFFLPSIQKP